MISKFHIADTRELCNLWSSEKVLQLLMRLDRDTMDDLNKENAGTFMQWILLLNAYPESMGILMHGNTLAGYWHFISVSEALLDVINQGTVREEDLTVDSCLNMNVPARHNAYFLGIAVKEEYRSLEAIRLLRDSFYNVLVDYKQKGIEFVTWTANAFTDAGEKLSNILGLKYRCDSKYGGKIYSEAASKVLQHAPRHHRSMLLN